MTGTWKSLRTQAVALATLIGGSALGYDLPLSDHFDSPQTVGSPPNAIQWSSVYTGGGTIAVTSESGNSVDGGQSLKLVDNSSDVVMFRTNGSLVDPNGNTNPLRVGYFASVKPAQTTGKLILSARSSSGEAVYFNIVFDSDGALKFEHGGGTVTLLEQYSTTSFTRVEVLADINSGRYCATVNGVDVVASSGLTPLNASSSAINVFRVLTDGVKTGTFYLDALELQAIPPITWPIGGAGSIYYIDPVNGNDTNAGTSAGSAWQTLWRVRNTVFNSGSTISLARGGGWNESLVVPYVAGSGGLTINAYGSGERPRIGSTVNPAGGFQFLRNTSFEESSCTGINDGIADYFNAWSIKGHGEVSSDAAVGRRSVKVSSGATLSQKVRPGYSACPMTVRFRAKAALPGQTMKVRILHRRSNGTVSYRTSGGWTTTPSDFQTFTLTTGWAQYTSNTFTYLDSNISYNCEMQLIAGSTGSVYVDDATMNTVWRKRDATYNIYEINAGPDDGVFLADWSGGNDLSPVPATGAGKTYSSPPTAANHTFDRRYRCIYVKDDQGGANAPSGHLEIAGQLEYVALVKGKKNVTLQSLDLSGGRYIQYDLRDSWEWFPHFDCHAGGLAIICADGLTVEDCQIHANGGANVGMNGFGDFSTTTLNSNITIQDSSIYLAAKEGLRVHGANMLIRHNDVYMNARYATGDGNAIGVYSGSRYVTIEHNNVHDNGSELDTLDLSVGCYNVNDLTLRYNYIHDNYIGGTYATGKSIITGTRIYDNIICNNGRSSSPGAHREALAVRYAMGAEVYNNVIVNNRCGVGGSPGEGAVEMGPCATDIVFKNNIVAGNSDAASQCYIFDRSGSGCIFNNNIYYNSAGGTLVNWLGTTYSASQEAEYQSARESAGYFRDPVFVSAEAFNFFLQPWSPALNSGADVSLTRDFWNVSVPMDGNVDRGACESPLRNGHLENGSGTPDDGVTDTFTNWTRSGAVFDRTTGYHGLGMKMVATASGAVFYQDFPMSAPNSTYTVNFWCRVTTGTLSVYVRYWNGSSWVTAGGPYAYSNVSSWTQKTFNFTSQGSVTNYRIVFYNSATPTTAYIDDLTISHDATEGGVVSAEAPQLFEAASRREHGGGGSVDIAAATAAHVAVPVECRNSATLNLIATFDKSLVSADASIGVGQATLNGAPQLQARTLILTLSEIDRT